MCVFCAFTFFVLCAICIAHLCASRCSGTNRPRYFDAEWLQLGAGVQFHLESLRLALIWDIPTWNFVLPLIVKSKKGQDGTTIGILGLERLAPSIANAIGLAEEKVCEKASALATSQFQ